MVKTESKLPWWLRRKARMRVWRAAKGAIKACGPMTIKALADGRLSPEEIREILTCIAVALVQPEPDGAGCSCSVDGQVVVTVQMKPHG